MKGFEYYKVSTVAQTLSLLGKYGEKASVIAGGTDMLAMMKDRVEGPKMKAPQYVIDVNGVKDLAYIREQKKGLKIGAAATLSDIAASSLIAGKFPMLSQAALQVAVPQIRNVGTLGGNLCQRPRCWYFRGKLFKDCFRKGGGNCYAFGGENQYHAIFPADTCAMVCPSDMAVALAALNARVEIATTKGNKMIPVEQFYVHPETNILRETILAPAEIVTAVEIPPSPGPSSAVFLKLKERAAFDFALVSVAAVVTLKNGVVTEARIVFGGIAPYPLRALKAEGAIKGKTIKDAVGNACSASVAEARPLSNNGYKVKATRGILEQALTSFV